MRQQPQQQQQQQQQYDVNDGHYYGQQQQQHDYYGYDYPNVNNNNNNNEFHNPNNNRFFHHQHQHPHQQQMQQYPFHNPNMTHLNNNMEYNNNTNYNSQQPYPTFHHPQQQQQQQQQQQHQPQPLTHFQKSIPLTRTIASYKRLHQIGEGTYGQVYKAQDIYTHQIVALKKIRLSRVVDDGLPRNVIREIKILKNMTHENMVRMVEVVSSKGYEYLDEEDERKDDKKKRLKEEQQQQQQQQKQQNESKGNVENSRDTGTITSSTTTTNDNDNKETYKGNLFLVLEYVSHDLSGILDMGHRFTPVQSKYIFHQLLSVLDFMHKRNYVHRDLKSSNILLDGNFKVKLADFGLARCMDEPRGGENSQEFKFTNKVVTLWYRAPELLLGSVRYNEMVDIWSAGCILAELLLGKALLPGKDELEQLKLIFNLMGSPSEDTWQALQETRTESNLESKARIDIVPNLDSKSDFDNRYGNDERLCSSQGAKMLIMRLLEMNPKRRWKAEKALDSQYFRSKPFIPNNPEDLGALPDFGDSHEFQTKPIRKKAKVIAQQASKKAKAAGENEKEAYEKAYNDFLVKAANLRAAGLPFDYEEEEDGTDGRKDEGKERRRDSKESSSKNESSKTRNDKEKRESKDRSKDRSEKERKRHYSDSEDDHSRNKDQKSSSHKDKPRTKDRNSSIDEADRSLNTNDSDKREDKSRKSSKKDYDDDSTSSSRRSKYNEKNRDRSYDKSRERKEKRDRSRSRSKGRSKKERKSSRDESIRSKGRSRRDHSDHSDDDHSHKGKDRRDKRQSHSGKDTDKEKGDKKKSKSNRDKNRRGSSKERHRSRDREHYRYKSNNMHQDGWGDPGPGPIGRGNPFPRGGWDNFNGYDGPAGNWDPSWGPQRGGGPHMYHPHMGHERNRRQGPR